MASIEFGADLAHMKLKGECQKNYMKKKSMNRLMVSQLLVYKEVLGLNLGNAL